MRPLGPVFAADGTVVCGLARRTSAFCRYWQRSRQPPSGLLRARQGWVSRKFENRSQCVVAYGFLHWSKQLIHYKPLLRLYSVCRYKHMHVHVRDAFTCSGSAISSLCLWVNLIFNLTSSSVLKKVIIKVLSLMAFRFLALQQFPLWTQHMHGQVRLHLVGFAFIVFLAYRSDSPKPNLPPHCYQTCQNLTSVS